MSRSELHDWECSIERICGDKADEMFRIAQDIYNTAYIRGKNAKEWELSEQEPCEDMERKIEKEYLFESLCDDLKKLQAENENLRNALEQEPCEDCVNRESVLKELDKYLCGVPFDEKGIDEVIKDLPSVQPKSGHWIIDGHHRKCQKCGEYFCITDAEGNKIPSDFCPNCGARMSEVS